MDAEQNAIASGAPARDLSSWSEWRQEADPRDLWLLELYGTLLVGQHAGMTEALSLTAVVAALELHEVPREEWLEQVERLNLLHREVMKRRPKPAPQEVRSGGRGTARPRLTGH